MKKHLTKENKIWFTLLPLLLVAIIYGLFAQSFIDGTEWKSLIYSAKFSSIQPKHLSLWSTIIFINLIIMLYLTEKMSKYRLITKLYVVLLSSAFGMWYTFDAFTRSFATLPDIATALESSAVIAIVLMAMFEIAIGVSMIVLSIKLLVKVSSRYLENRDKRIDWILEKTDMYAMVVYGLVFIIQLLLFIAYNKNGLGELTNRRWPNIGPESQGLIAIVGLIFAWKRISAKRTHNTLRDWKMNIASTIVFALVTGFFFHDSILFIYDYVSNSGAYHDLQVWNTSTFVNITTVALICIIPFLFILMALFLVRLNMIIIYVADMKPTKEDKKKIKKMNKKSKQ